MQVEYQIASVTSVLGQNAKHMGTAVLHLCLDPSVYVGFFDPNHVQKVFQRHRRVEASISSYHL